MPSGLFMAMAVLALLHASALLPNPQQAEETQNNIDKLVLKAQEPDLAKKSDWAVLLLRDSWRRTDLLQASMANAYYVSMSSIGFGILAGIVLQVYVIVRVRTHLQKCNSMSTAQT